MRRLLAITALCLLAAAPAASAATRHVVRGAGFGHGIGMSQYGAYGFAQKGFDYKRILRHYYTGTQLGTAPSRPVRVLLQASDPYVRFTGATKVAGRRVNPDTVRVVRPARGGPPEGLRRGHVHRAAEGHRGRLDQAARPRDQRRELGPLPRHDGAPRRRRRRRDRDQLASDRLLRAGRRGRRDAIELAPRGAQGPGRHRAHLRARHAQVGRGVRPLSRHALAGLPRGAGRAAPPPTRRSAPRPTRWSTHGGEIATTFFFSTSGGRTENIENSFVGAPAAAVAEVRAGSLRRHLPQAPLELSLHHLPARARSSGRPARSAR